MLSSNQPYQRAHDSSANGAIMGGLVGAAAAGSAHRWGDKGIDALRGRNEKRGNSQFDELSKKYDDMDISTKNFNKQGEELFSKYEAKDNRLTKAKEYHQKGFGGGWKGKAVSYGGSVLAGGLLGAGIDSMSN